ncbi:MAG TPA: hypothetical protein PLU72_14970 [Candidatus Ozemobacteraceae bacterium]|nr:hypothetical protein [Candidatus Ozemobacteraceae bacterium]
MSMLKYISGATSCELCGLPLKMSRFAVNIDGHRVTVCANCKSFIAADAAGQEVLSNDGEAPPVKTETAQSPMELLRLGLAAGLALLLALTILI